jgi:hypothetical protein
MLYGVRRNASCAWARTSRKSLCGPSGGGLPAREPGHAARGHVEGPISRGHGPVIEQARLITPTIPSSPRFPREQLQVRAARKPLNATVDLIGLAAVLAARLDDEAFHISGHARRRSACSQETLLNVRTRPIAEAGEEVVRRHRVEVCALVDVCPVEAAGIGAQQATTPTLGSQKSGRLPLADFSCSASPVHTFGSGTDGEGAPRAPLDCFRSTPGTDQNWCSGQLSALCQ